MATNFGETHPTGMPRSARICIAMAYAVPLGLLILAVAAARLTDVGRFGGAALFVFALILGGGSGALLCVIGTAVGVDALVRARERFRWYDYLLLTAGAGPLVAGAVAVLLPRS